MEPSPIENGAQELQAMFEERFALLPHTVQDAIKSTDLEKRLRALADTHKLHLDQWEMLENEVKLALYGFEDAGSLPQNLESQVGVSAEEAAALATSINEIVFEPIREQLERDLSHPEAKDENRTDIEKLRDVVLAEERKSTPAIQPATPPSPPPTSTAVRAPLSGSYHAAQPSVARTTVEGDPYREQVA